MRNRGSRLLALNLSIGCVFSLIGSFIVPRFVILHHDHPRGEHWDFMLESGTTLLTWALPDFPIKDQPMEAERLPDHRIAYLDYEGDVSNDRGVVARVEEGIYEILVLDERSYRLNIRGEKLNGIILLIQTDSVCNLHWKFEWSANSDMVPNV
jgi:hypothetical protein